MVAKADIPPTKTQQLIRIADEAHRSLPFPEEVPGMGTLTGDVKEWARMLDEGGNRLALAEREAHVVNKHHENPDLGCDLCKSHAELEGMSKDQLVGLVELLKRELGVAWHVAGVREREGAL